MEHKRWTVHLDVSEIYIGKINFICKTESSFLFGNIKIDAQDAWYASNSKSNTLENGYSVVEGHVCQEDGILVRDRPGNGRMDRQTDRQAFQSQYIETDAIHFLFSLLRIMGLYMFRAHPQEVFHKRYLVYCMRVMSIGCTKIGVKHVDALNY
jgi:hypothetical protein